MIPGLRNTWTPLTLWLWAALPDEHSHPEGLGRHLQRQLGIRRYETAWLIRRNRHHTPSASFQTPLGLRSLHAPTTAYRKSQPEGTDNQAPVFTLSG